MSIIRTQIQALRHPKPCHDNAKNGSVYYGHEVENLELALLGDRSSRSYTCKRWNRIDTRKSWRSIARGACMRDENSIGISASLCRQPSIVPFHSQSVQELDPSLEPFLVIYLHYRVSRQGAKTEKFYLMHIHHCH